MSKDMRYETFNWLAHKNVVIKIDGIKHRLKVDTFRATYPHQHTRINVMVEPINKNTKYYLETKRDLGDDWSTDVLDSSIALQTEVINQLHN